MDTTSIVECIIEFYHLKLGISLILVSLIQGFYIKIEKILEEVLLVYLSLFCNEECVALLQEVRIFFRSMDNQLYHLSFGASMKLVI